MLSKKACEIFANFKMSKDNREHELNDMLCIQLSCEDQGDLRCYVTPVDSHQCRK